MSLTLLGTSIGCDIANNKLSDLACFLVDSGANEKGKTAITRINDEYMEKLLVNDAPLLERYKAVKAKHNRQSAQCRVRFFCSRRNFMEECVGNTGKFCIFAAL